MYLTLKIPLSFSLAENFLRVTCTRLRPADRSSTNVHKKTLSMIRLEGPFKKQAASGLSSENAKYHSNEFSNP